MVYWKSMHIHLSPRHLVLTGAINSYVVNKLAHLDHEADRIIAAHVVLMHDEAKKKSNYVVKIHIAVPGPDIHAEDREAGQTGPPVAQTQNAPCHRQETQGAKSNRAP